MLLLVFCIAGIIYGAGFCMVGATLETAGVCSAQPLCARAATKLLAGYASLLSIPFFSFLSIETRITRYASFVEVVAMIYVNIVL